MPAYVTVQLVIKDPKAFGEYREVGLKALTKHNGRFIAGGPDSMVLEDTGAGECGLALLEFPDADAARGWIDDPDLEAVHDLRRAGARTRIVLLAAAST